MCIYITYIYICILYHAYIYIYNHVYMFMYLYKHGTQYLVRGCDRTCMTRHCSTHPPGCKPRTFFCFLITLEPRVE